MSDYLLVHREGGVLTLTFNRVDKKNALLGEMYTAMAEALEQAVGDDSIRVAVFQGAVEAFTAGMFLCFACLRPCACSPSP